MRAFALANAIERRVYAVPASAGPPQGVLVLEKSTDAAFIEVIGSIVPTGTNSRVTPLGMRGRKGKRFRGRCWIPDVPPFALMIVVDDDNGQRAYTYGQPGFVVPEFGPLSLALTINDIDSQRESGDGSGEFHVEVIRVPPPESVEEGERGGHSL
jgi:hypothetical protein